jgi:beta-galactosidase/beta-glucuronidase
LEGQTINLHFGGVSSAYKVWLNGQFVGYAEDSFLSSEFNITPYLKEGENILSVWVIRWSDGSFLEDQDQWRMSGIHREVFLHAEPSLRIADFFYQTKLGKDSKRLFLVFVLVLIILQENLFRKRRLSKLNFTIKRMHQSGLSHFLVPSKVLSMKYIHVWTMPNLGFWKVK